VRRRTHNIGLPLASVSLNSIVQKIQRPAASLERCAQPFKTSRKLKYIFLLLIGAISCRNQKSYNPKTGDSIKVASIDNSSTQRPHYNVVKDVISEKDILIHWMTPESGYPNLYFSWAKDSLTMEFDGQCQYTFPVKANDSSLIVYWAIVEDCTHDIGVKNDFGLKSVPAIGRPFMSLTLTNDSTLTPKYFYTEWVERVNAKNSGYKHFPDKCLSSRYY
jgi:hypothetical protein